MEVPTIIYLYVLQFYLDLIYIPVNSVTMATGGGGGSPRRWDRNNPEQQGLVYTDAHFKDLLNSKRHRLCRLVSMSCMWPALRQLEVISEKQEEDIKVKTIIKLLKTIHRFCYMLLRQQGTHP